MASIQIRNVDPILLERLQRLAQAERRTLNQQILYVLERVAAGTHQAPTCVNVARRLRAFWASTGIVPADELCLPDRGADDGRAERIQHILEG